MSRMDDDVTIAAVFTAKFKYDLIAVAFSLICESLQVILQVYHGFDCQHDSTIVVDV